MIRILHGDCMRSPGSGLRWQRNRPGDGSEGTVAPASQLIFGGINMSEKPTYQFKGFGGLVYYLDNMGFRADELRRQARTLQAQAEAIDQERLRLMAELQPMEDEDE